MAGITREEHSLYYGEKNPKDKKTKVCKCKGCEHKGKPQPITEFYINKVSHDGYNYYCKSCLTKYSKKRANRKREIKKNNGYIQAKREGKWMFVKYMDKIGKLYLTNKKNTSKTGLELKKFEKSFKNIEFRVIYE